LAELGKSILGILDVDADLSFGDGNLALAHDLTRRLVTSVLLDDPAYGYNLYILLSSTVDAASVQRRVEAQCMQDERVQEAEVEVTQDLPNATISIAIWVLTANGPFEFTIEISKLGVEVLLPEAA
jgi:hypothetical protein